MLHEDLPETGAACIARTLKDLGVTQVFGVCGDHINTLYWAANQLDIEIVGARTESAAVHMADGFARATGKPGVAFVTGGPGHTNAVSGLAVAQSAASPVILISGLTPVDQRDRGGQQVLYQADIVRSVTKLAQEILSPHHLSEQITRAFRIALSDTPGPVSLSVPVDVLAGKVEQKKRIYSVRSNAFAEEAWPGAVGSSITHACELLTAAQRPILILGSGAWSDSNNHQLVSIVERLGIPAFTIEQARGLIPDDGKLCFGYADPFFNSTFRESKNADIVLLAGTAIDFHTCFGSSNVVARDAKIIQIHPDAKKIGVCLSSELSIVGPVAPVLKQIMNTSKDNSQSALRSSWVNQLQQAYASGRASWDIQLKSLEKQAATIHPLQLCASLQRHFTERTGIVVDAGDFIHWPRAYFEAKCAGHWMDGTFMGNLGTSLPLAIGMQIAFPDDPVWAFVGDGGFGFYSWEVATAVKQRLPIKIIVGNDQAWGIEKRLQLAEYSQDVGCDLPYTRYDQYAELVGAKGFHIAKPEELDQIIDAFIATKGPALLNVDIQKLAGRPLGDFSRIESNN